MNLNYFSSLIQEAGQSKAYKEDNRNIYLLEGDIFIDFDVQFNDTNQVHAFITTDQDRCVGNDYSATFSEYFIVASLVISSLFRLWKGKIPFTFHQSLRDAPYRYNFH